MAETQRELWIFAYGSLMWRPDFAFVEHHRADLAGYHRSLCIESHVYRGTPAAPGLVFGLDRGGTCTGVAFRIAPQDAPRTLDAVRRRELILQVYREETVRVTLFDGRVVEAITYVADPTHASYAGGLPRSAVLDIIRQRSGASGTNRDYVLNTQAHLVALGVDDPALAALCVALTEP